MNIVKIAGLVLLATAGVNLAAAGSLFVTVLLVVIGGWMLLPPAD
jgi:hypothetical protein